MPACEYEISLIARGFPLRWWEWSHFGLLVPLIVFHLQATNLHRHKIDHVTIPSKRGPEFGVLKRVEDVSNLLSSLKAKTYFLPLVIALLSNVISAYLWFLNCTWLLQVQVIRKLIYDYFSRFLTAGLKVGLCLTHTSIIHSRTKNFLNGIFQETLLLRVSIKPVDGMLRSLSQFFTAFYLLPGLESCSHYI